MKLTCLLFFCTLLLIGCAPFKNGFTNYQHLSQTEITHLNGQYDIKAIRDSIDSDTESLVYHNAFTAFYRGKKMHVSDTLLLDSTANYSFTIKVLDEKNTAITYLKNRVAFKTFNVKSFLKKDGYLYLRNNNIKLIGVPYLFGGISNKKVRLAKTKNNALIIESVTVNSGAVLFLFPLYRRWNYRYSYACVL